MPMIDLPLEELRKYNGINPCPGDLDEYWERAIAEMKAMDSQVTLIPAEFQVTFAECFDLYYIGVKGAKIVIYVRWVLAFIMEECYE